MFEHLFQPPQRESLFLFAKVVIIIQLKLGKLLPLSLQAGHKTLAKPSAIQATML